MRELFCCRVVGVWDRGLLCWIVNARSGDDDVCILGKVREEEIQEMGVPEMVDGEGLLDIVSREVLERRDSAWELKACIEE